MKPRSSLVRLLSALPLALVFLLMQAGTPGSAAEEEETKAAARPAAAQEAQADAAADDEDDDLEELLEAADRETAERAPAGPSPQRFTPSEQVRADFDVAFPVDI